MCQYSYEMCDRIGFESPIGFGGYKKKTACNFLLGMYGRLCLEQPRLLTIQNTDSPKPSEHQENLKMLTIDPQVEVIQGDEPAAKRSKTTPSKKTKAPVPPPPQLVLDLIKTMSGSQLAEFKKSVNGAIADQIKHLKEEKQRLKQEKRRRIIAARMKALTEGKERGSIPSERMLTLLTTASGVRLIVGSHCTQPRSTFKEAMDDICSKHKRGKFFIAHAVITEVVTPEALQEFVESKNGARLVAFKSVRDKSVDESVDDASDDDETEDELSSSAHSTS